MARLKADLHVHASDDPYDDIAYSAETLIEAAAKLNVDVLAFACHERLVCGPRLSAYAEQRGVLLIPAVELLVKGKHVVVLNPDASQAKVRTFERLRATRNPGSVVLAPHPYYPGRGCLRGELERHIDLFDAIEWCSLYLPGINPNRRAAALAREHGLPLIGTSDTHFLPYVDSTFTWIEVEDRDHGPTVESVIRAVQAGRVTVRTTYKPLGNLMQTMRHLLGVYRSERSDPRWRRRYEAAELALDSPDDDAR
jgi:predicted metal-dependent phosphoesterase TrpH